jgi:hypothetical protein
MTDSPERALVERLRIRCTCHYRITTMPHLYCNSDAELDSEAADAIERLRACRREAVELVLDLRQRLNAHMSARQGTHWDGCESAHNDCRLLREADAFLAALDKKEGA